MRCIENNIAEGAKTQRRGEGMIGEQSLSALRACVVNCSR